MDGPPTGRATLLASEGALEERLPTAGPDDDRRAELEAAFEALRARERRLTLLVRATSTLVWELDADGRALGPNPDWAMLHRTGRRRG